MPRVIKPSSRPDWPEGLSIYTPATGHVIAKLRLRLITATGREAARLQWQIERLQAISSRRAAKEARA